MSKIVISGYYGFNNAGDEAMLTAIVEALRKLEPSVELTVISGNPTETKAKYQVESIYRFDAPQILASLKQTDLLISGGGSLLQDVTSKKSLLYYLSVLAAAKHFGKKVMLFAEGIGPIRCSFLRTMTKWVCRQADLITVRDEESRAELERLGIDGSQVRGTADAVFSLETVSRFRGVDILRRAGLDLEKPLIGVSVRHWENDKMCLQALGKALHRLGEEKSAQVVLLPLQNPTDIPVCDDLSFYIPDIPGSKVVLLHDKYTTEEFLSIIANFKLVVGMRLHALVFAAVMQVPFLAVSYDPKVDAFVHAVDGVLAGTIASLQEEDVVREAKKLWDDPLEEQKERLEALRTLSQSNVEQALALLQRS